MASFLAKIRRFLLIPVIFYILLVFLSQGKRFERFHQDPFYLRPIFMTLNPFQKGFHFVRTKSVQTFEHYFWLQGVWEENINLKTRLGQVGQKLLILEELDRENERMRTLLGFREQVPWRLMAAHVISFNPLLPFHLVTIDRGEADGLKRRQPVITPQGLVGQVFRVTSDSSQVLLMTDPTSAIDAADQRSRVQGLVTGHVTKAKLNRGYALGSLEYFRQNADIEEGDLLVTSGLDAIFPKGIPIGRVTRLRVDKVNLFQTADIIPEVDFLKLEEVFVILHFKGDSPKGESHNGVSPKGDS